MEKPINDNELPWSLITAAIEGDLTSEDKLLLDSWLLESPANREVFERLERVWKEGLADYPSYLEADETRAWSEMQARLVSGSATRMTVVRSIGWQRWTVAAAVLLVIAGGAELWQRARNGGETQYATAMDEQRTVALGDGSRVVMEPQTRLRVTAGKVTLINGKASFAVVHQQDRPFEVVMDGAKVKDIGTRFIIAKNEDSIQVVVTEGKVAYTNTLTGESRELAAGSAVVQMLSSDRRGEIKVTNLRFDNARLMEVIAALEERYGKKVALADTALGKKRLTVHLDEESFDDAIKVICVTLNLEYEADSNGYILKNRATR